MKIQKQLIVRKCKVSSRFGIIMLWELSFVDGFIVFGWFPWMFENFTITNNYIQ